MIPVSAQIEALLFAEGKPMTHQVLRDIFTLSQDEYDHQVNLLRQHLEGRGIRLVETYDTLSLATHPDVSKLVRSRRKEERLGSLSKATVETLSIVLYNPGVEKSTIDYIRGVNSQFILRALLGRGLITRDVHILGTRRTYHYHATSEVLQHLGLSHIQELPHFEEYTQAFRQSLATQEDGRET